MKIPKYIEEALIKRRSYAFKLDKQCRIIDRFLSKHNINPDDACWLTGVEIYVNPDMAEEEVRRAIKEK